ncbi:MAG: glycosyltransferase family 2 protein [Ruminococcaceae bacterium]|nr:glycosyltransferase family 2 protein [Oscillospiraceae bacterium]
MIPVAEAVFAPKVSIVIPVYNGANYLHESIDSALAQTYENLEVLVVNDGSCDDGATEAVALSYGDRIRYFKKENGGVSSALNCGIENMTGEYFSWLSHDDRYEPEKVANSVAYLAGFEDRDRLLAMCGGYYIDKNSKHIRDMHFAFDADTVYNGLDVVAHILKHGVLDACCLLIPKTAFDECGMFDEELRFNQDALMWYRIFCANYGLVVRDDQKDVAYRLHAAQTSKTRRDLLLTSSLSLATTIAPTFAAYSTKERPLLRMYARRHARMDSPRSLKVCIRVGKEAGVISFGDVCYLYCWLLIGKCRNLVKAVYHRVRFHK